jgi:hypothetical protein
MPSMEHAIEIFATGLGPTRTYFYCVYGRSPAAVVAYILKQNKMPAGKQPLPSESEELRRIRMTSDKP